MKAKKVSIVMASLCATMMLQAQVKLSFNPDKGATYSYLSKLEMKGNISAAGQEIPMNTSMDMLYAMKVTEKSGSEVSVDYLYKELAMSMQTPMGAINYNSKNSALMNLSELEKLISQVIGGLIDKALNVVLNADGSVKSVSGFQEIMAEIQKNTPPAAQAMTTPLLQSFNDEAIKKSFEQSFNFYPKNTVKTGDSWTGEYSFDMAGITCDLQNTYTLKSVKDNTAVISVTSVVSMKQFAGGLSGDQTGEITVDLKTGMPKSSMMTQTIKGKLNQQGVEASMDMVSKMTMSLQK